MKKNKTKISGVVDRHSENVVAGEKTSKPKTFSSFVIKLLCFFAVVFAVVFYTDSKGYFSPGADYHERFTNSSFQSIIKKDTIDVCLFGNSHVGNAINNHMLSNYLGCVCYTFYQNACDLKDVYFMLSDVLDQTSIRVAVIETYVMTSAYSLESTDKMKHRFLPFQYRRFSDKLKSAHKLFGVEDYWAAWSNTVRNHDFIFRDTARIAKNLQPDKYKKSKHYYLGDNGLREKGISDSLIAVYDSLGPIVDASVIGHDIYDFEYMEKIVDLCNSHGVKIVFLTVPEYYRNIKNYGHWHDVVAELAEPYDIPWLDLQLNYDTTAFAKDFFQNRRHVNQHVVYAGTLMFSTRLGSFLKDSLDLGLPDRSKSKIFVDEFYGTEGYFLSYPPKKTEKDIVTICDTASFRDLTITNAYYKSNKNDNDLFLKIAQNEKMKSANNLSLVIKGRHNGQELLAKILVSRVLDYTPSKHALFRISLVKDFEPIQIVDCMIESK